MVLVSSAQTDKLSLLEQATQPQDIAPSVLEPVSSATTQRLSLLEQATQPTPVSPGVEPSLAGTIAAQIPELPTPAPGPERAVVVADTIRDLVFGAAKFASDAFVGAFNLTFGSANAIPLAQTPEEEAALRAEGFRVIETMEQRHQQQTAIALTASVAGGGAIGAALKAIPQEVIRRTIASTGAGALFGATRPKGEEESLLGAVVADAVIFGGLGLAGSLWARKTRPPPLNLSDDILTRAARTTSVVGENYGKAVAEEAKEISRLMTSRVASEAPLVQRISVPGVG
ncbi:hypothetical protein LCGC14_1884800, partial [marine sediment metagenome]